MTRAKRAASIAPTRWKTNFRFGFRRMRTADPTFPPPTIHHYMVGGLHETNANNILITTDIDGPAGDLARYSGAPTSGTAVSYLYYSGHGDVAAEADNVGTRTADYAYDPFGAQTTTPQANTTVERWTGRWNKKLDTATNLIEMGARPYDPTLGRFLSVDPIDGGSLNNYDYAGQDPVNGYDLNGKLSWHTVGKWSKRTLAVIVATGTTALVVHGIHMTTGCYTALVGEGGLAAAAAVGLCSAIAKGTLVAGASGYSLSIILWRDSNGHQRVIVRYRVDSYRQGGKKRG